MSYPVMNPCVPWSLVKSGFHKTPHFNSMVQKPAAGRGRSAIALMPYPTWDFSLDLNLVLGGESVQGSVLSQFLGCFMASCGQGGFFLFTDPNDNTVDDTLDGDFPQSRMLNVSTGAAAPMSTVGDGVSTHFQLARQIDQAIDILQQVSDVTVYVNGSPVSATVSSTGVVTFSAAPVVNGVLSWSGKFQYLCQFTDDTLKDLARVSKNSGGFLWSCGNVNFESVFV